MCQLGSTNKQGSLSKYNYTLPIFGYPSGNVIYISCHTQKKKLQYFHLGIFNNRNILFFHLFSEVTFDCETTDGPFYPEQTPFEISNTDLPQIETETSTDTTLSQGKEDVTRGIF